MRLLTLELRLVAWLMVAWIAMMLLVWAIAYAPWLLVVPIPRRLRRRFLVCRVGGGEVWIG